MAMIDHAPESTNDREYGVHLDNYHGFLHGLWSVVALIAFTLIMLAIFFG